jgi:Na+/H+-dicarboxylate symporter
MHCVSRRKAGPVRALLAVEAVPDIFRTVGNVTSDMAVARLVATRAAAGVMG